MSPVWGGAAAGGGGGGGAITLLNDVLLAADGTFDISGIAATYNDLLLVLEGRGTRAGAPNEDVVLRFNNDSGANYDSEVAYGSAATLAAFGAAAGTFGELGIVPGATGTAGRFGVLTATIYGYAGTTRQKSYTSDWHSDHDSTTRQTGVAGGTWRSTAAVNRVQVFGEVTAALLAGSRLRLYGRT
jgi:hypothetical protein